MMKLSIVRFIYSKRAMCSRSHREGSFVRCVVVGGVPFEDIAPPTSCIKTMQGLNDE
jgi:hypothetical protein